MPMSLSDVQKKFPDMSLLMQLAVLKRYEEAEAKKVAARAAFRPAPPRFVPAWYNAPRPRRAPGTKKWLDTKTGQSSVAVRDSQRSKVYKANHAVAKDFK